MTQNPYKAKWAAEKAQALDKQASEVAADRDGDWRAWRRRQDAAATLRREADRFRSLATRYRGESLEEAA